MQVSYEGELVLRSAQLFFKLAMLDLELKLMGAIVFAKKKKDRLLAKITPALQVRKLLNMNS